MPKITTSIGLPPEVYAELEARVGRNGLTKNAIIVRALQAYFKMPLFEPHIPQMEAPRIVQKPQKCKYKEGTMCHHPTVMEHKGAQTCEPMIRGHPCRLKKVE